MGGRNNGFGICFLHLLIVSSLCFAMVNLQVHARQIASTTMSKKNNDKQLHARKLIEEKPLAREINHNQNFTGGMIKAIEKVKPAIVTIIGQPEDLGSESILCGTGIVIRKDGWIVTCAHVMKDLVEPSIIMGDEQIYRVKKCMLDEESDIALLKIDAHNLKVASFAKRSPLVKVGESVAAIGSPKVLTLQNSVSCGSISGVDREDDDLFYRVIQTDTAINPGNSGGALINSRGEVIGINYLKLVGLGVESLGFAVPADTVNVIIDHLFTYGKVKRASLGIEIEESWPIYRGFPINSAVKVTKVVTMFAKQAGIFPGDLLYAINGKRVKTAVDIHEALKIFLPGQSVKVTMLAKGDIVTKTIVLSEQAQLSISA